MARLALPLLLAAALPTAASAQSVPTMRQVDGPVVSLTVTEEVMSAPDMATIGTGVTTRALTAREAMRLNAAAMDKVIAAVVASGIERRDIQTSGLNLSPQYDYSNRTETSGPKFLGYEASNQLSVKVRKLASAGEIIDRMVDAGATNISGPSFGIADDRPLMKQARDLAVRTAAERAQFYATASGYRAARLLSISETGAMPPPVPMPMMARAMAAEAAPKTGVEPGQLSTSITLNFQYVLEK